jgi:phage FluMu protein Com
MRTDMPKYQCPECEAVLRRDTPLAAGKKIKCPKCETVFLPESDEEAPPPPTPKKKPKPAAKAPPSDDDDDQVGGTYGVETEKADPAADKAKKAVKYGSLRDKFEKSKRGPAMAETVRPSNLILMQGIINCLAAITLMIYALWPFIFSESSPQGAAAREKVLIMVGAVVLFALGCMVSYGASKLQDLESYNWAMAGSIMAIISLAPTGAIGGLWAIQVLKKEEVIDGFEETLTARDY